MPLLAKLVAPTSRQAELGLDGGWRKLSAGAEQLKCERVDPKHMMEYRHLLLVAWSKAKCVPVSVLHHHSLPLTQKRHHMERDPAKQHEQGNGEKWAGSSPGSTHLHRLKLGALETVFLLAQTLFFSLVIFTWVCCSLYLLYHLLLF